MANPGCLAALRRLLTPSGSPARGFAGPAYRLRDDFVSPAELSFYRVLRDAVGERYAVCAKVSLADLFYAPYPDRGRALGQMNRIDRKHVDFLLCDPATLAPLAGIELDDDSHRQRRRAERDRLVEGVFREAGLPLLRLRARHAYRVEDLAALVAGPLARPADGAAESPIEEASAEEPAEETPVAETALSGGQSAGDWQDPDPLAFYTPTYKPPAPASRPRGEEAADGLASAPPPPRRPGPVWGAPPVAAAPRPGAGDEPPLCPRCGRVMVLRTAKNGRQAGSSFWGCPSFPRCRMVVRFAPPDRDDDGRA